MNIASIAMKMAFLNIRKNNVTNQMKKLELYEYAIQKAINILPMLSRWKAK